MFFRNFGICVQDYTVLQTRRPQSVLSLILCNLYLLQLILGCISTGPVYVLSVACPHVPDGWACYDGFIVLTLQMVRTLE
jgi:hypothetical protein